MIFGFCAFACDSFCLHLFKDLNASSPCSSSALGCGLRFNVFGAAVGKQAEMKVKWVPFISGVRYSLKVINVGHCTHFQKAVFEAHISPALLREFQRFFVTPLYKMAGLLILEKEKHQTVYLCFRVTTTGSAAFLIVYFSKLYAEPEKRWLCSAKVVATPPTHKTSTLESQQRASLMSEQHFTAEFTNFC